MASKLDRLKELGELKSSGAITQEEFEKLKSEILSESENPRKEEPKKEEKHIPEGYSSNKERVNLKSFRDEDGKMIKTPDIEYINFKDISDKERVMLTTFLRKKQISFPQGMTQDEIDLANKFFTHSEIVEMNSERSGFNYPWSAILGLLAVGVATIFLYISPCFIVIGAGTTLLYGTFNAIWLLTRGDATKLDKRFSIASLILAAFTIYTLMTLDSKYSKSDNGSASIECGIQDAEYRNGYASDRTAKMMSDYSSTCSYVIKYNESDGRNTLNTNKFFKKRYNNGNAF